MTPSQKRARVEFARVMGLNTRTHGLSRTKEYSCWQHIKLRCLKPDSPGFPEYGGRGITLHPKWIKDFMAFFNYVGKAPSKKHTIERINNDRGYIPGNVKWATKKEQANNRRKQRNIALIKFKGKKLTKKEWANLSGLTPSSIRWRLRRGWPLDKVLSSLRYTGRDITW